MELFNFPEHIERYAKAHTTDEDDILYALYRTTHLKTVHPQMLSGKVQGQFLSMISRMIRPSAILEIGTFTGYSAYCLAKGLSENGKLITIEVDEELADMTGHFFEKAGLAQDIELINNDAMQILPTYKDHFELIFLDANKEQYPDYYPLCIDALKKGGFLIVDNVLWNGKVATKTFNDESTKKIREFNTLVQNDERVDNVLITVRDGLMLIFKN